MSARIFAAILLLLPAAVHAQSSAKPRLDAHGFPLPDGAIARLGSLQFMSPAPIAALAMSPDGKRVASAALGLNVPGGGDVAIWDADSGRIVAELSGPPTSDALSTIGALSWSRDGRLLASVRHNTHIMVWNAETGKAHGEPKGFWPASKKTVLSLRFIDGDRRLAVALADCHVEIWDFAHGKLERTWTPDKAKQADLDAVGAGYRFTYASLSPSGAKMAWLALAKDRSAVLVYETTGGKLLATVKELEPLERAWLVDEAETLVCDAAWRRREKAIQRYTVVNVADGRVRFHCEYGYAPTLLSPPSTLGGSQPAGTFQETVYAFKNGPALFTTDGLFMIQWDAASGKKLKKWWHGLVNPAFSADGRRAVTTLAARRLVICNGSLQPLGEPPDFVPEPQVHFLPDGHLAAMPLGEGKVNLWDPKRGQIVASFTWPTGPGGGSHDAPGKLLASVENKRVVIRDLTADRPVCALEGVAVANASPTYPKISADGTRTLVYSQDKQEAVIRWFDSHTGRELGSHRVPLKNVCPKVAQPAFWCADDASIIGYYALDSRLMLVHCGAKGTARSIGSPAPTNWEAAVMRNSPDWWYTYAGAGLVLAHADDADAKLGTAFRVFEANNSACLRRFYLNPGSSGAAFSLDGATVLSRDARLLAIQAGNAASIVLFETATGRLRGRITAPNAVHSFDFSPDGQTLATSCNDTSILIWDLKRPLGDSPALPAPKNAADADKLWQRLDNPDPAVADPALWALCRAPDQTLPLFKERVQPAAPIDRAWLKGRIAALNSANFRERVAAGNDLVRLGDIALPALRAVLAEGAASLEQKRRIDELIARIGEPVAIPPGLRELRAVEVLERIASEAARAQLAVLAAGEPTAPLTCEARLALERLKKP